MTISIRSCTATTSFRQMKHRCQVYHNVENELEDLTIAGCWVHCRRRFDEAQAICREEGKLKELSPKDRLAQRQAIIKPLVDALFVYPKQRQHEVPQSGRLHDAFGYALNQEKYLRVFLDDGEVPIDNNASERAIRGFCIGRKNWEVIDTIRGAESSAIIYSIAETAKANKLKPYEYFEYLLTELSKYMDQTDRSFLENLLPWSSKLPDRIRKPMKEEPQTT